MAELMVGGAFLSSFLNVLFDRLASRQVVDFFREKKFDQNLFERLKISLMTVGEVIDHAETKQHTRASVKEWLEELKDTTYHAEDLLDEIVTLASKPSKPKKSFFNTIKFESSSKKFDVKRVVDIVDKMEFLASQKENLGLSERVGDHNSVRGGRITTSLVDSFVYGRDGDKQKIVESVLMDVPVGAPIPVITIVGMGGIGKTTLAKMVYNDEKVREYFEIKAWVCVTQELDVFGITKTVLDTITSSRSSDIKDLNLLQLKLKEMLTGKKTLLVLDDVWNKDYEKWCTLCAPFTTVSSGSKIIVTTRDKNVASIVRTVPFDRSLMPLSDDDSWLLFTTHAFGKSRNGDDYPHLEVIGKHIVGKCKGLPLAIKLLGGLLRNKYDVKIWENIMKSKFWDSPIGRTTVSSGSKNLVTTRRKNVSSIVRTVPFDHSLVPLSEKENLASQKENLGLREHAGDHNSIREGRITTSLVDSFVYGRDGDKQKIVESVLMDVPVGDPIPVITIVGMGGIGKTTLAKMVYNDEKVREYFEIKAWVCVTQELDVFGITKTVLDMITSSRSSDIKDLNLLQLELKGMLTGKKILLVLDDVLSEDYNKWCTLRDPFTTVSFGSKIIVTTRNDSVASIMCTPASPSYSLKHLSDENGWKLFAHHAFETTNDDSYPHLEAIGKQIVEKCKGLPLSIKLLGGVLRNKDDVKVWENVMKSELWDLPIGQTSILPALRLSYHFLPTHLKPCFAYCAIFPQDYEFEKEKLVLLWMAEGFVIDKTDKSMEESGEEYFDELFSRSFFQISSQDYETYFVMHDLNHDLAKDVSGKFCHTLERRNTCRLSEKVRHLSYSKDTYGDHSKIEFILNAKNLRTFLPVSKIYSHIPIVDICDLLPKMSCIRVLSLSSYGSAIKELPDSICTLIHLRYFDLSNTAIQCLPNKICQLYNLQTLLLTNCRRLINLPANFGELVNLRRLDINGTLIDKLPPRISKLENLQTLSRFNVGEGNCSGLRELNGLRQLKGPLSITGLHNVYNVEDVIEANLKEKMSIEQLSFEWGQGIEVSNNHSIILDKLQPSAKLKCLTLVNYGGTRLSNWLGDASLFNLTYLKISNCLHCLSLPSLGQLPSLIELHFECMMSVTRVGSEFYGNDGPYSVKPFQKLEILKFESMPEWEEWSPSGGVDNDDFPKLEKLWIQHCPKLCGNLPELLPSLHDLCIEGCSELTTMIPRDASLRSLKLIECKNVMFENMSRLNSLKSLQMRGFQSNHFPSGMMENCTNLEELRIGGWSSLSHFPDDGLPTTLRTLDISSCNNLLEFLPKETFQNYKYLEELTIEGSSCNSMTSFPLGSFPHLKKLYISSIENLESFSMADDDHENLKFLLELSIEDCDKLINFPSSGLQTPNLSKLGIYHCKNLKSLPEGMNTQLPSLRSLRIHDCEEVEYSGGLPSKLHNLSVRGCKKLMAKRREWNLHTLSSLAYLIVEGCEEIESLSEADWQLPTSIICLVILALPNLKTIDTSRLPNLHILNIHDCPKVKFNSNLRNYQDLPASFNELPSRSFLVIE